MPERQRRTIVSVGFPLAATRLWEALTDFPRMDRWFVGVRHVQIVEGEAPRVGAHRRVRFLGGHCATELITWWEPPAAATTASLGRAAGEVRGTFRLRLSAGTRLVAPGSDIDVGVRGTRRRSSVRWQITYRPHFGACGHVLGLVLATPLLGLAVAVSLRRLRRRLSRDAAPSVHPRAG